ncbi:MAG: DUF5925 domain-containing protein [Actinomycetota bacterium]|nr:DUF5925 domain-containing protein [Actinomycetota bacterium]
MHTPPRNLALTYEVESQDLPSAQFLALALERGLTYERRDHWGTTVRTLPDLGEPLASSISDDRTAAVFDMDGALVELGLSGGHVWVSAVATSEPPVDAALRVLREAFPAPDPSSAHEVTVTFWTYGRQGPQPAWRSIAVPSWDEIRENYASPTRTKLEAIMRNFQPAHGGQLILWHGKAGTGKTFGLRALAWEWREWCDLHYIVDPDSFFGEHADYLMSVLLQPEYDSEFPLASVGGDVGTRVADVDDFEDGERQRKAWQLLILEDTGELLTADARAVIGQGLSRFLNVVDGLIGQGLRVLVLVTTNEEIRKLHPAVARPGRCAANIEFVPLSVEESKAWLERHGVDDAVSAPTTLAALYAKTEDFETAEAERTTGFAG